MSNLNLVKTAVNIAGQNVHFVKLNLFQKFYQHHRCEILVDHDAFGDKKWMADPIKIFNLIGETVSITMTHSETKEANIFIGIVSNVSFKGQNGAQNYILIEGVSDTIKLSGKPSMDSFVDKTLDDIVTEAAGTSGNGAAIVTRSDYKKPIYYIQQYKESCFDFINRLCYLYGEAFWNDGTTTYFGKPEAADPVILTYEKEVTGYDLRASLLPPKLKNYEYLVVDDEERDKETRKNIPETPGYLQPIMDKAESIYISDVIKPLDALVADTDSILKMVDIERTRTVADMLVLSCTTQTCKAGIGKVVSIEFPKYMEIDTSAGDFIITEITHTVDQEGHYSNAFSGVRAALGYIPMPNVPVPIAVPERATVLSNADPKNKGRIQVQFAWQKLIGKETNWIRVQTPDAGGSDKVASNRGLVTIPEEGDTVMINFEYGDPNRPYSSGSLFTSKNGGGGGQGNKNKSLTTRSGSTVTLNDDEGQGSITIKDPSGNEIVMDGSENIKITAPTSLKIDVGGNTIEIKKEGTTHITTNTEFKVTVGGNTFTMTTDSTTLETPASVAIQSASNSITGQNHITGGDTKIDGGNVFIN